MTLWPAKPGDPETVLPTAAARQRGLAVTKAVFTPQLWDRNRSGTQPGARVHTCSTGSSRSGTSRPPRDVIAVERFRNGSGWLCGVNAQPDAFRSRLDSPCVIMTNIQYILPKSVYPAKNPHTSVDTSISALASKHLARVSNPDAIRKFPIFVIPKSLYLRKT